MADEPGYQRKEDVIYGRKLGTALTMDIFTPVKEPKRVGDIGIDKDISQFADWFESHLVKARNAASVGARQEKGAAHQ